jgi:hypothetical protein
VWVLSSDPFDYRAPPPRPPSPPSPPPPVVALPLLDIAAVVAAPSRSEVSHALRCVLCGFELGLRV